MLKKHLQYQKTKISDQAQSGAEELLFNSRSLAPILTDYSGPCFVYDLDLVQERFLALKNALPHVSVHYALKANPSPEILKRLKSLGCRIDAVSGGEIQRAFECGFEPRDILFSGVAKTQKEIEFAVESQIHQINVESLSELKRIADICSKMKKKISVALRLNPDVEIQTHKYIATGLLENKFGLELAILPDLLNVLKQSPWVVLSGVSLHLGSQMLEFSGLREGIRKTRACFDELRRQFPTCQRFDFGGGIGILYEEVNPARELQILADYALVIQQELADFVQEGIEIQAEPGRWLVAHAGILVCQVQYIKETAQKTFVITDSGMNHLIRPSLYEAYHWITPWVLRDSKTQIVDVVGPICESSDFFSRSRPLSLVKENDFLVIADCGAYGASMSSDYNLQARAKEIFLAQAMD
ncbi:MAG: diaminopimelate decarboxylase [Bdellovibrionales bacterium]|nr:diaminopimelate decarboxylase [Bdellovibrionales bacterium]